MDLVKVGRKGQVTIPRSVLQAVGIAQEGQLAIEVTADGGILLRPAVVYPIEMYTEQRIAEFAAQDAMSPAMEKRVQAYLKKARKKKA